MVTITEYKGKEYIEEKGRRVRCRNDYIRIEYPTGYVDMKMSRWEKIPQKTKNKFLKSIS